MKHLKTKLMASVAMLMVATVMISSASFAWFTISTRPEVSGVTAGLATNQALEIALASDADFATEPAPSGETDTGKNITWGNLVDVSAYFNNGNATLRPAFFPKTNNVEGALSAPTFGADGRTSGAAELKTVYENVGGTGAYSDGVVKVYKDKTEEGGVSYAYQIDYFMRTNVEGADILLLETGADRGAGVDGAGTTISEDSPCTVRFKVDYTDDDGVEHEGSWVTYYTGAAGAKFDFETPIIESATANQIYKVSMLVYWDGSNATNENLNIDAAECAVNAQFTTDAEHTLEGLGVEGNETISPKPTSASTSAAAG